LEHVFFAFVVRRPMVFLSAEQVRSTGIFYPTCYELSARRGFTWHDNIRSAPPHTVFLCTYGVQDDAINHYVAADPLPAPGGGGGGGSGRAGSSSVRAPFRIPASEIVPARVHLSDVVDVKARVYALQAGRQIAYYLWYQSDCRITYHCQYTIAYKEKVTRTIESNAAKKKRADADTESSATKRAFPARPEDNCAATLVFVFDADEQMWQRDDDSNLLHTCPAVIASDKTSARVVAKKMIGAGTTIPDTLAGVKALFPEVPISYDMASEARKIALETKYGTDEENFARLRPLFQLYEKADPNFYYVVEEDDGIFTRYFFSFAYAKRVIDNGLSFAALDASFSRHVLRGTYYYAMTMLPTNHLLPLAIAFCATEETEASWRFFCEHLVEAGLDDHDDLVILSDRRSGLANALNAVFKKADKNADHRHVGGNAKVSCQCFYSLVISILTLTLCRTTQNSTRHASTTTSISLRRR